jgi:hypothetical protein
MSKKKSADPAIDLPPVGPILGSRGNRLSFPNTRPEEVKLVGDCSILVFSINYGEQKESINHGEQKESIPFV